MVLWNKKMKISEGCVSDPPRDQNQENKMNRMQVPVGISLL